MVDSRDGEDGDKPRIGLADQRAEGVKAEVAAFEELIRESERGRISAVLSEAAKPLLAGIEMSLAELKKNPNEEIDGLIAACQQALADIRVQIEAVARD